MADRTRPDGEQVADLFLFLKSTVASRLPEGIFPSGPGKGAVATLEVSSDPGFSFRTPGRWD